MASQKLYTAEVYRPLFKSMDFFDRKYLPKDWKNLGITEKEIRTEYGKDKGTVEFCPSNIGLIAKSSKEARERIEKTLRSSFGKFMDEYNARWKSSNQDFWVMNFHTSRKRYVQIEDPEVPLYVANKFNLLGIALSFKEIKNLVKNNTLPEIFVKFPELIPENVFIPSRHNIGNVDKEAKCVYDEEELSDERKNNIAKALVAYEENRHRKRERLKYNLFNAQTLELFPEDVCFWTYQPNSYNFSDEPYHDEITNRFSAHFLLPRKDSIKGEFTIGNKEEILEHIRKLTESRIRSQERSIKSLKNKLEERLNEVSELHLSLVK